ncbi:MAG: LytTR family transcriptional regulator DNA-binding domain-containing protein, partial [Flavobacterium sp.]|nr:LytTR family transcriptional regulator DNA-binding domain-containing protein [Flavobacterium sp.]
DEFVRVHRSFVVSINHIKEVLKDTGGWQIITTNNKKINVSRSYTDVVNRFKL